MVLRSELKEDVNRIIHDLQTTDYRVPSIVDIAFPVVKKLVPFYLLVCVSGVFVWGYHGPHELLHALVIVFYSLTGSAVITIFSTIFLYYPNFMMTCLSDKVKNNSFLCSKLRFLIDRSVMLVHIVSIIFSLPFVIFIGTGLGFIIPFVIYFVTIMVAFIVVRVSLGGVLISGIIGAFGDIRKK